GVGQVIDQGVGDFGQGEGLPRGGIDRQAEVRLELQHGGGDLARLGELPGGHQRGGEHAVGGGVGRIFVEREAPPFHRLLVAAVGVVRQRQEHVVLEQATVQRR